MKTFSFDIPLILKSENLSKVLSLTKHIQFYTCFNNSFPTGRPNDSEEISIATFTGLIKKIKEEGCDLNYLLNGNIGDLDINSFEYYFSWILKEINPCIITFSDSVVYHKLRTRFDYHNFELSAIAGIRTELAFKRFIAQNCISISDINKIVLHHDFTVDGIQSKKFVDYLEKQKISARVLVTESCYYRCCLRKSHYNSLINAHKYSTQKYPDYFQFDCILKRLMNPESLLDLSGFLMPEQLDSFSKATGINSFKISGRSKSADWITNTAQAYIRGKSPDNLYDIIVFTTPYLANFNMNINDLFYLNSKAYLDMCLELSGINDIKARRIFLKQKSVSFFNDSHLRINDPNSIYDIKNGELLLRQKGNYLKLLEKVSSKYSVGLKAEI